MHSTCAGLTDKQIEDKEQLDEMDYFCDGCLSWTDMIQKKELRVEDERPRMHLYDFVYFHKFLEEKDFRVSPTLLHHALSLGIFPSRQYVNSAYRKAIATQLKGKIKLPTIKQDLAQI